MNSKPLKTMGLLALVASLGVGCAGAPPQKKESAEPAIAEARTAVNEAQASGYSAEKAAELLQQAEQAAAAGNTTQAQELALKAEQAAAARKAIEEARKAVRQAEAEGAAWRDSDKLLVDAEAALAAGETARAIELANQARRQAENAIEQKKSEQARLGAVSEPAPTADGSYTVSRGDSLWRIAGKAEIYGNPYHWPLIYKANRDKIRDADLIFPGQVFTIKRNVSSAEMLEAARHARTRGAWSLGTVESSDRAYLSR